MFSKSRKLDIAKKSSGGNKNYVKHEIKEFPYSDKTWDFDVINTYDEKVGSYVI